MEFKGKKVDWIVSSDDIIHIDISENNADVCILTELKTGYKNEDLYNKNLVSHAHEMLEALMECKEWIENCNQYTPIAKRLEDLIKRSTTIQNEN